MRDRAPTSSDAIKNWDDERREEDQRRGLDGLVQATKGQPGGGSTDPGARDMARVLPDRSVEGHQPNHPQPTQPRGGSDSDQRPTLPPKDPSGGGDQLRRGTDLADKGP
jgi:hypothetical protein